MARPHERVFALIGALLFFATTVAVSAVVIWQAREQKKSEQEAQDALQSLSEANTNTNSQETEQQPETKEGQLQGTKLNDFTPMSKIDSLQKIDTQVGTGDEVKPGDTITAHYTGAVAATGVVFQSSHDFGQPVAFSLSGVIKGWTDGVPGMKVGGKRRLLIPADQAYGANPPAGSGIPANADLVFDIELVKIGQ